MRSRCSCSATTCRISSSGSPVTRSRAFRPTCFQAISPARLDALVGDGIEAAVRLKHRWRLRRLGQLCALEPADLGPWASGEPAPRSGNNVVVLVDGAAAFRAIAQEIGAARRFVHICGWDVDPAFELVRGETPTVLGPLLAETAERIDVRVLVWAGAPVPIFHPTRR